MFPTTTTTKKKTRSTSEKKKEKNVVFNTVCFSLRCGFTRVTPQSSTLNLYFIVYTHTQWHTLLKQILGEPPSSDILIRIIYIYIDIPMDKIDDVETA